MMTIQTETGDEPFMSYLQDNLTTKDDLTMHLIEDTVTSKCLKETYISIRKRQLRTTVYVGFTASLLQLTYLVLKYLVIRDQFFDDYEDRTNIPKQPLSSVLHFVYMLCILLPILCNYLAFYFFVKESYRKFDLNELRRKKVKFTDKSFIRISQTNTTADIEHYID
jgi:hypothetical protein